VLAKLRTSRKEAKAPSSFQFENALQINEFQGIHVDEAQPALEKEEYALSLNAQFLEQAKVDKLNYVHY